MKIQGYNSKKEPIEIRPGIFVKPLTVRDFINIYEYRNFNKDVEDILSNLSDEEVIKIISYASLIETNDLFSSLDDKILFIYKSKMDFINDLESIDEELSVEILPIVKKCESCGNDIKIRLSLQDIKAYP